MRRGTIRVFDDYVLGTTPVYSPSQLTKALAQFEKVALQIVADEVSGTAPTLAAMLQTSSDGRHWVDKSPGLAATAISAGQVNALSLADSGATPSGALRRLKIALGGTDPKARVRVSATMRNGKQNAWLPPNETGLALWLRGGDWSLDGSGDIATWTDLSGNGRDYSPTGNAPSPDGSVGGQPAVKFTPSNTEFLVGPSFSSLTAGDVFIVTQLNYDPAANTLWTGFWRFGSSATTDNIPWIAPGVLYDGFGSTARKTTGNPVASMASPNVYEVRSASGAWSNHVNGSQVYTTSTNGVGWHTSSELGSSGSNLLYGAIAEVIMYDHVLDAQSRQNVMQYIGAKYGIAVS